MSDKRQLLEQQLIRSFREHNPLGAVVVPEYMNEISTDIAKAVGTINGVSAPFIIALLETYASSIRDEYPGIDKIVSEIKGAPSYRCKVVLPHG